MSTLSGIAKIARTLFAPDPAKMESLAHVLTAAAKITEAMAPVAITSGELQRLLYLCEARELAATDRKGSLLGGLHFRATVFGPQCRELDAHIRRRNHHVVKYLGDFEPQTLGPETLRRIEGVCAAISTRLSEVGTSSLGALLVSLVQSEGGGWQKNYTPAFNMTISQADMDKDIRLSSLLTSPKI